MRAVAKARPVPEAPARSARERAIDVLLDQRLFVLDSARHDALILALNNPPAPGPRLRALLRRAPAWSA
jgi:uncharacterized protein (DUF1778 family)